MFAVRLLFAIGGLLVLIVVLRQGNLRQRWRKLNRWYEAMWIFGTVAAVLYFLRVALFLLVPERAYVDIVGVLFYSISGCLGSGLACSVVGSGLNTLPRNTAREDDNPDV